MSPLAGQAIIADSSGRTNVSASPAADRMARGEEWLQDEHTRRHQGHRGVHPSRTSRVTSRSSGQAVTTSAVGLWNPAFINSRKGATGDGKQLVCTPELATPASAGWSRKNARMSRTPDQRVYSSGAYDS